MKNRAYCGFDLILLVYAGADIKNESLSDRTKQLESLFKKAGLLVY